MKIMNPTTNKELKDIVNSYPDESEVKLYIDGYWRDINSISIEYKKEDDYEIPTVILTAD